MRAKKIAPVIVTCAALTVGCNDRQVPPDPVQVGEHTVIIRMTDDMQFVPENPTISVGDTVIWINAGDMPHTSTDQPGLAGVDAHNVLPEDASTWDSGLLGSGTTFRAVFDVPGDYTYLCFLHETAGMVGRLAVR